MPRGVLADAAKIPLAPLEQTCKALDSEPLYQSRTCGPRSGLTGKLIKVRITAVDMRRVVARRLMERALRNGEVADPAPVTAPRREIEDRKSWRDLNARRDALRPDPPPDQIGSLRSVAAPPTVNRVEGPAAPDVLTAVLDAKGDRVRHRRDDP